MKRVNSVRQIAPIVLRNGITFPLSVKTKIDLDKKNTVPKKQHCIFYQQSSCYGNVGDYCHYISHEELFELEEKGMIKIN